jgi:lipopolysaccharide export system protein LptA
MRIATPRVRIAITAIAALSATGGAWGAISWPSHLQLSALTHPNVASAQTQPKGSARPGDDRTQPITVDADRMERYGKESLVVFTGNVVARQNNSVQYADRIEVYLDEKGDRILRTVSTGTVKIITRDCRTGTARRAEYHELEQRVVLSGNARVWQEDNVVSGDTITIFLAQDKSVVQGGTQERVKAVFQPREERKDGSAAPRAAAVPCQN